MSHPNDCGCGPQWRKPKANGTCATCGGWLPGEREVYVLPWLRPTPDHDTAKAEKGTTT